MYTVLRVDLETLAVFVFNNLIHACRAVALRWLIPFLQVDSQRDRSIFQLQVAWLIFRVVNVADKHRVQLGEADHTVRFRIVDLFTFVSRFQHRMIRMGIMQSEWHRHDILINVVECATQEGAELMHRRAEVTAAVQFFPRP